jgi:hypothetical protein
MGVFFGGLGGLALWEIGHRNAYGLGTICFAAFLPLSFLRVFHPQPALAIVTLTTVCLIVGYSYQDTVSPTIILVGQGWRLTWIRFVLSTIGLVASYIWASLPPRYVDANCASGS